MALRFLLLFISLIFSIQAQALRCGNELILEGDTTAKLLKYCGKPTNKAKETATVFRDTGNGRIKEVKKVETWTYNFGPSDFYYIISVEKGKVVAINTDGYGH